FIRGPAGGNPADGNHIRIARETRVANISIVAADIWIGTCSSAQGGFIIASAILKRRVAHPGVVASVGVFPERSGTNGRVVFTGNVLPHRSGTNAGIVRTGGVVPKRCSANRGQTAAGGVHEERSKTNGQVEGAVAVGERLSPNGHVKVASRVAAKRPRTNRHVILPAGIGSKRIGTHGGIVDPSGGIDTVQRSFSPSCVSPPRTRAVAVLCFERRRKRKPGKRQKY